MTDYLLVKNWETFQHYKERNPPWIKFHRAVLDDYEFCALSDASKAHLMLIWLLASSYDGRIPSDAGFLARKLAVTDAIDLSVLIDKGFLIPERPSKSPAKSKQDASKMLAERMQAASLRALARGEERQRREEERRQREARLATDFDRFWSAYPNKRSKVQAVKAWGKLNPDPELVERIIQAVQAAKRSVLWTNEGGRFIPHGATWLNGARWEDEVIDPGKAQAWWIVKGYGSEASAREAGVAA